MTAPDRRANATSHVSRWATTIGRSTPGPVTVRVGVAVAALGGFAAGSGPDAPHSSAVLVLVLLGLMPAVLPRGPWPTAAIAAIVGWYLLETSTLGHIDGWRPVAVAACVYLVHTGSALAAVLPYDAVVGAGVLGPWALRAGVVILLTAVFAVVELTVPRLVGSGHHLLGATLAGLATLAAIIAYVVYLGAQAYGRSPRARLDRLIGLGARRRARRGPRSPTDDGGPVAPPRRRPR